MGNGHAMYVVITFHPAGQFFKSSLFSSVFANIISSCFNKSLFHSVQVKFHFFLSIIPMRTITFLLVLGFLKLYLMKIFYPSFHEMSFDRSRWLNMMPGFHDFISEITSSMLRPHFTHIFVGQELEVFGTSLWTNITIYGIQSRKTGGFSFFILLLILLIFRCWFDANKIINRFLPIFTQVRFLSVYV